ncbi:hypothetical protein BRD56_11545 [Thermoplasmatales archaeon SW_10_69_26]|nr:MAG: hypothetical protein BRD56_11545 [Thermoplasmatales archaeon SW_10_69_26]
MGKKKTAIVLTLACVVVAFAIPYMMGGFDAASDADGEATSTDDADGADAFEGPSATANGDDANGAGSPTDQAIVDDLLTAANPGSSEGDTIRSRLAPLTATANDSAAEPYPTPEATTLYQATLAHPAHSDQDLRYVETLQPLPEDLDRALAQIVIAHGVSTQMLNSDPAPGASLRASVTMATALDTAMPTLERYVNHPVWDTTSSADEDASTAELQAPPLPEALLDLYASLGYDQATVDELEAPAEAAAGELPPEESRALARLVTAQANVQRATASSLLFVAAPASHGPSEDAVDAIDDGISGTPLEQLTVATQQLRAAAQSAHDTIETSPADEQVREEPWSDPLGLIVVGTRGEDTYDDQHGTGQAILDGAADAAAGQADGLRALVGNATANTSDVSTIAQLDETRDGTTRSEAGVDAANRSTEPKPGWHMLVLDPGGNDTYRNNAGGIEAGSVIVRADVDARGASEGVESLIVRGDRVCSPGVGFCEPDQPPRVGAQLQSIAAGATASQGPVPLGLPLTATVVDTDGDDSYEDTGDAIQGSADGLGVGLLYDRAGDDEYEGTHVAQGASENYGIGILVDGEGNDTYEARERAQGWVELPDPSAEATVPLLFFEGEDPRPEIALARIAEGSLIDTGGNDGYRLANDVGGQGIVETPEGIPRQLVNSFGYPAEQVTAQLVDVGGDQTLPIPELTIRGRTTEMTPSRVNVSEETPAHFWLTRRVPEPPSDDPGGLATDTSRFKTAVQLDPEAVPDPVSEDAVRAGKVQFTCREGGSFANDANEDATAERLACGVGAGLGNTPPLLLFGEPTNVTDPPALTVTFGGDTHYNGSIASMGHESSPSQFFAGRIAARFTPEILTDLAGNDTYEGENNTIASLANYGVGMVIDRQGADEMIAQNRSVAYSEAALDLRSGPVAAVLDLDGDLTVRSGERSQGFASLIDSREVVADENFPQRTPRGQIVPPMALLDAGASADELDPDTATPGLPSEDEARNAVETAGLDLTAGNESQGFSEGLGVGVVVGSPARDSYEVDGWGQGVHDGQQLLTRFCEFDPASNAGEGQADTVRNRLRDVNPWAGGIGLLIDPAGDDDHLVDSGVGLGDATADEAACSNPNSLGPHHVNVLGLGTVLDVRGDDAYEVTDEPPRPASFPPRSCSGGSLSECEPNDDRAWMSISEEKAAGGSTTGVVNGPSTIGFGVDNVRNAHHLGMAACRNLDAYEAGFLDREKIEGARERVEDAGFGGPNTSAAASAAVLECDEALADLWEAYLGEVVEDTLSVDRRPNLEVALPRAGGDVDVASGQTVDASDELGDDRLPLPDEITTPEDPEPLFLGEAARPQCQDRQDDREVSPRGDPDLGCLSVTRDIDMGQWLTNDPASDRLDPGDTLGCNCSVRLFIEADQGGDSINLRTLDDRGLYPDRGRATTQTTDTQTWYDAFNRFRVPLTVDEPIQDGRLRGDFVQPEAAADFPLNLSQLPTGLARAQVTAVVEDTAAEETGGAIPSAVERWRPTFIHERSFQQAYVSQTDDETTVFLAAPGPVSDTTEATLAIAQADADLREELTDQGWTAANATSFSHELPSKTVIDGPSRSPVIPQAGAPACAALIDDRFDGDAGVCWTGSEVVVGLPLGEVDPADVDELGADGEGLPVEDLTLSDSEAEPRIRFSSEDTYGVDTSAENVTEQPDVSALPDVRGVPGSEVGPAGRDVAETILGDRSDENWALLTVEADEDEAIGFSAIDPDDRGDLDEVNLTTQHIRTEDYRGEGTVERLDDPKPTHEHAPVHRSLGVGDADHAHLEIWQPPSNDAEVLEDESLVFDDTERHVMPCANLNYVKTDDVQRLLQEQARNDSDLRHRTCATFAADGELNYLLPLGGLSGTQIVRLEAHGIQADGETTTKQITGYIDPVGPQGQVFVDPAANKTAETSVRLQLSTQTAETPMLTQAPSDPGSDSDLDAIALEARGPNTTWQEVDDTWDQIPTPLRPSVDADVNLTSFTDPEADASTVELRGVLEDESNNTLRTNVREFVVDRAEPNITESRIVSGAGQDRLILSVDEAIADVDCRTEDCPLEPQEPIPGAEPEPFLDRTRIDIGARTISIPILNLERGPTYQVGLEVTDTLGNTLATNLTLDTYTPITVDASPMENTLVNKTVTLSWTTETRDSQTISTFSSAYLLLPDGPCALMQSNPGVVPANEEQTNEEGPLSVRGEAGESACVIPDEGVDATLLIYALAPNIDGLALDRVPVHVDTAGPSVTVDGPEGWVNDTARVQASSNDSLATQLEIFVDGEPQGIEGSEGEITISEEGEHAVLARATDEAGNAAVNRTTVRIDKTDPSVDARVLGVRGGLALVNATAADETSSVRDVQLFTRSTSGPAVPGVGDESVLLSVPVEPSEDELVLRTRDQAQNTRDLRLSIADVPRVEDGPLVTGVDLTTPAPDTLRASFDTSNETTPVVIVDAGDRHVERALEPGTEHALTIERLPPGSQAQLTITTPRDSSLVPVLNATAPMPEDSQPPTALGNVQAEPVEGAVRLTWEEADDDIGVREVVIQRDGTEVARPSANTYTDEPGVFDEHTYKLAAVDHAGNRGPWSEIDARPIATFQITELTTDPEVLSPDDTVTVEATVQTPAGLTPDVVTVSLGGEQLPMQPADEGPYSATYEVTTRLPTLDVAAEETDMVVNATAGDRTETETFPAPVVATVGPTGGADPDEVPAAGIGWAIATIALVAVTRRRWSH